MSIVSTLFDSFENLGSVIFAMSERFDRTCLAVYTLRKGRCEKYEMPEGYLHDYPREYLIYVNGKPIYCDGRSLRVT